MTQGLSPLLPPHPRHPTCSEPPTLLYFGFIHPKELGLWRNSHFAAAGKSLFLPLDYRYQWLSRLDRIRCPLCVFARVFLLIPVLTWLAHHFDTTWCHVALCSPPEQFLCNKQKASSLPCLWCLHEVIQVWETGAQNQWESLALQGILQQSEFALEQPLSSTSPVRSWDFSNIWESI